MIAPRGRILMYDPTHDALFGAQRSMLALADGLRREGFSPVIATGREGALTEAARGLGLGVEVIAVPLTVDVFQGRALRASPARKLLLAGVLLQYSVRIFRVMRRREFDVLYANDLRSVLFLACSRALLGRPLVWYIRGGLSFGVLSAVAAVLADQIVLISLAAEKALPPWIRERVRSKTVVNYIGIDVESYGPPAPTAARAEIRRRYQVPAKATLVTSIGSISPRKGFDTLIAALERVVEEHPGVHLAIAGVPRGAGSDGYLPALQARVREKRLPVSFLGWLDDVRDLLSASDVFVLASREEGLGRVILEAMASRLAPVVTYAGGSEETVVHGESGFIVPSDDPEALAGALRRLLSDPVLRARMGARARRRCEETFSMDAYVSRFAAMLGVAGPGRARPRSAREAGA
jgi:glycosyltransferase involved in cell wall biosynthesis